MNEKIQLSHPEGKNAVRMEKSKYDTIRTSLLKSLKDGASLTHTEILKFIQQDFHTNCIDFQGSIQWHLQSVKMDMEAKKEIFRIKGTPERYALEK